MPGQLRQDLPNMNNKVLINAASKYCFIFYYTVHIGTEIVAAVDDSRGNNPSIFHSSCEIL